MRLVTQGSVPRPSDPKRWQGSQIEFDYSRLNVNDYDGIASVFEQTMGKDIATAIFEPACGVIERYLDTKQRLRHLDLACGTGSFLIMLAKRYDTCSTGLDLSSGQIRKAKEFACNAGVASRFLRADMRHATFPTDCDLVTCNLDSINHIREVQDWLRVFTKVRECLRDGGLFLFDINTVRRLVRDWAHPEVIVKPNLTYVQCGLPLERGVDTVRRGLLMQIFSQSPTGIVLSSALVEHTAVPISTAIQLLRRAGFGIARVRRIPGDLRDGHLFMRNRSFILARR